MMYVLLKNMNIIMPVMLITIELNLINHKYKNIANVFLAFLLINYLFSPNLAFLDLCLLIIKRFFNIMFNKIWAECMTSNKDKEKTTTYTDMTNNYSKSAGQKAGRTSAYYTDNFTHAHTNPFNPANIYATGNKGKAPAVTYTQTFGEESKQRKSSLVTNADAAAAGLGGSASFFYNFYKYPKSPSQAFKKATLGILGGWTTSKTVDKFVKNPDEPFMNNFKKK